MAHRTAKPIGAFERNLTWWVFGCIVAGIALGQVLPGVSDAVGAIRSPRSISRSAVLIWLMIIPMLLKIDFARSRKVTQHAAGSA